MYDFEKLGAFYPGKRVDTDADKLTDELVLCDEELTEILIKPSRRARIAVRTAVASEAVTSV